MNYLSLYITFPNKKEAKKIGKALLEKKLVACVNIFDKVESMYFWEGKICGDKEVVMFAKTREDKGKEVTKLVKAMHSYECPCIVALPIVGGSKEYGEWVDRCLDRK